MTLIATAIIMLATTCATEDFDLHAAVAQAEDGAVVRVPAGVHALETTLVIAKPLTLEGVDGHASIIDAGGTGEILRVIAPGVTIRRLVLRNSGALLEREHAAIVATAPQITINDCVMDDVLFGVILKGAPHSVIRNNRIGGKRIDIARRGDGIRLWRSEHTLIEGNHVHDGRDVVVWYSSNVLLRRNVVERCRYGMHFMFTDTNTLEDNILADNSVGAFLMYSADLTVRRNLFARNRGPSGYGLGLKDMDRVVAEDNLFLANRVGAYLDNSPHSVDVFCEYRRNVFAQNEIGIACLPNIKRNRFAENTFMENEQQVAVVGSGAFTGNDFSIDGRGNFWSDYRGYDADRDGIGDLPYRESSLFENLMEREPRLRLLLHSPVQQAIDLAARAFPIVLPEPRVVDEFPLMSPAASAAPLGDAPRSRSMFAVAAALLATALGTLAFMRLPMLDARDRSRRWFRRVAHDSC